MADESIRRLQAELQEVYRSAAKQKLSERNVVELVSKLVELRMIDVLYTTDGKTYLTPQQLSKEIKDELIVNGGRVSLIDLQQLLNVDYSHIESRVNDMMKHDSTLSLVLGQLIDSSYRQRLAEEINDFLHEKGHVTVMELTKSHDLPADFLRQLIEANVGKTIKGQVDEYDKDIVFTNAFIARMKARIRGAFSAVTVPTAVGPIRQAIGCQEHLFHTILEELISQGRLAGMLSGSRQDKSQFLPEIYSRAQNEWVDNFFKQNGYLEYDALSRLGIGDAKGYIKKRFKTENLVFLSSCCVGPSIYDSVEYSIQEALSAGGWVDVTTLLPSVLSQKDASEIIAKCLKNKGQAIICDQTVVASDKLVSESLPGFKDLMTEKAEKTSKTNPGALTQQVTASGGGEKSGKLAAYDDGASARDDKREQRRKKAAMAGSTKKEGTGGREVKMKSTKKKGKGREVEEDSDDERQSGQTPSGKGKSQELSFMTIPEIEEVLSKQTHLADCPPNLISEIASKLHRPLHREYQEVAKSIFLKATGAERKKTAQEIQDKVNGLWTNAHLFERGLRQFQDPVEGQLVKHLLKTVCSDLANTIVIAVASDNMVNTPVDEEHLTPEARLRMVGSLPKASQEPLGKLLTCLNGSSLEEYFVQVEKLSGPEHLGLLLKKPDKRKERQLIFNHRQCLAEQLRSESDPAMCLHFASVLLFQTFTQCMLHVPGRLVPQVLHHISSHLEPEKMTVLTQMQDLVVRHARYKSDPEVYSEEEVQSVASEMAGILDKVKDIALTTKKASATADE